MLAVREPDLEYMTDLTEFPMESPLLDLEKYLFNLKLGLLAI